MCKDKPPKTTKSYSFTTNLYFKKLILIFCKLKLKSFEFDVRDVELLTIIYNYDIQIEKYFEINLSIFENSIGILKNIKSLILIPIRR